MIGHDTEFFAFDTEQNKAVPVHSVGIGKDKVEVKEDWFGITYFRDGYALEINSPASTCRAHLWRGVSIALRYVKDHVVPAHITFISDPVVDVDLEKDIINGPKDVQTLGCHPTFDPYKEEEKHVEVDPLTLPFRTCGAHLHVTPSPSPTAPIPLSKCARVAKFADLVLGLPHVIIFGDDKEFKRRELYGQAGEFRQQTYKNDYGKLSYGFEYRVLSSRIYNHPGVFSLFSGIWKYAIESHFWDIANMPENPKLDKAVQRAINNGKGAEELLEEVSKLFRKYLYYESTGMRGFSYIPKDWGTAILKLREKNKAGDFNELLPLIHTDAHWGWSEYNTGIPTYSASGAHPAKPEEPWEL